MYRCVLCRFQFELDDAVVPTASGECICVRCFTRETETARLMPKSLRGDVMEALAGVS